jgi:hypothetical protein
MSQYFDKLIDTVVQSTGANTGSLTTTADRASFQTNVKADIARLVQQYNNVVYPAISVLRSGPTKDDVLEHGIEGRTVTTFGDATEDAAECYWNTAIGQPASIKETIDYLLSDLARLENLIAAFAVATVFDDTSILSAINCLQLDRSQMAKDAFGTSYSVDCDGNADLTYSLAHHVDALGAMFSGFPGTGLSHSGTYPTLSLSILSSNITWNSIIPQTVVASLPPNLAAIRTFVGMDAPNDSTPDYSAHVGSPLVWISDADSLEKAIALLDQAVGPTLGANVGGGRQVYKNKTANTLNFRTFGSASGLIGVTQGLNLIDLDLNADLNDLGDAVIAAPANGDLLTYETATAKWKNKPDPNVLGADWVPPKDFIAVSDAPATLQVRPGNPIIVNYYDHSALGADELSLYYLKFTGGAPAADAQRINWTLGAPHTNTAATDPHARNCRVLAYFMLPDDFAGWGGAGGTITFELQLGQSTAAPSAGIIPDGQLIDFAGNTWGTVLQRTITAPVAAPALTHYVLDFGITTLNPYNVDGVVHFRLLLDDDVADVPTGDFADGNAHIWLLGTRVVWLR